GAAPAARPRRREAAHRDLSARVRERGARPAARGRDHRTRRARPCRRLMATQGEAIWRPPPDWRESTGARRYLTWLDRGLTDYDELHHWSISDLEGFWASLWDYFGIRSHVPYGRVLGSREMPGAEWFPGARLNYAEHMVGRDEDTGAVAVVA